MASVFTAAFLTKLHNDATLTGKLSTFNAKPAIFATRAPEAAALPYVVLPGSVSHEGFDTKTTLGHDILKDIGCYAEESGSPVLVEDIAERVRTLFHRQTIAVVGFTPMICLASGPIVNDGDRVYGRIVTVRLVLSGG